MITGKVAYSYTPRNQGAIMAVGIIMDFPGGSNSAYDRVLERMGLSEGISPPHCLFHMAGETDRGFRVVDVWDSREAFQKFSEDQIAPLSAAEGFPPPQVSMWEIHNTLQPAPVPSK